MVLGAMAWSASQAQGVVVRAFTTSSDLEKAGYSGPTLARRFLDRIDAHQYASRGTVLQRNSGFSSEGDDAIRLEIPQTGLSVSDLQAMLRDWLGHERTLDGAVTRNGDGVTVSVRLTGLPAVSVSGPEQDLDALLSQAADQVYALAEPQRAVFAQPDTPEGEAKVQGLLTQIRTTGSSVERADGFSFSAARTLDNRQAVRFAQAATQLAPDLPIAHMQLGSALRALGQDGPAHSADLQAQAAFKRPARMLWAEGQRELQPIRLAAQLAADEADFGRAVRLQRRLQDLRARRGVRSLGELPQVLAAPHDLNAALAGVDLAALSGPETLNARLARAEVTAAAGRRAEAAAQYDAIAAELARLDAQAQLKGHSRSRQSVSLDVPLAAARARAVAEAGDLPRARDLIGSTPLNCYRCRMARGHIAWLAADYTAAGREYEAAEALAPDLPFAFEERGRLHFATRDLQGAQRMAAEAARRAPNWADPLKLNGDAFAMQGKTGAAARAYRAALKLAPR
ncbi:hypothetical protein DDF67_20820 [Caulobacter endophyticus]|uniref:Uncharacterized protein n=2 Tax=Caulobacter endophyticus TaxID=2172652 RepID=A0A2T9JIB2_9CAUL|nr:hypothetical protein DDF67_20820 [Caulobacter endophyticus]